MYLFKQFESSIQDWNEMKKKTFPDSAGLFLMDALVVRCPTWSKNLGRSLLWRHYAKRVNKNSTHSATVLLDKINTYYTTTLWSLQKSKNGILLLKLVLSIVRKNCYSEQEFCEIFTVLLSYVVPVKSKVKILHNFVAFSVYMNL